MNATLGIVRTAGVALLSLLGFEQVGGIPQPPGAVLSTTVVAAPAMAGDEVRFGRAGDGMFYVTAEVNGTPIRFLVDTGASVVVLTPADARRAGIVSGSGGGARMRTAGGVASMRWARIDRVRLAGRDVEHVDAAVMRGGTPVSLLGQNLLARMDSVHFVGGELRLR